jgi:anaerobic C4-dicarboxylate transporter
MPRALAALGRRKNDPEYLRRLEEGIAEYRKMIQEELEREEGNIMTTIPETLEAQKERMRIALERIAERKDDPEYQNYVEELFREAKEARRRINEEELRQMETRK